MRDKDIKFAVEKKLFFRWFIICVIFLYIFASPFRIPFKYSYSDFILLS